MTKDQVLKANACATQINTIEKIIFNEFSPNDLKITAKKYYEISEQLRVIGKILADSYNPLVTKS